MRIHIAADHAGFELKQVLLRWLTDNGHEPIDHGAPTYDEADDYPSFCISAAEAVVAEPGSLGLVVGGSGNGEQIAANKVRGARAALGWSVQTATLARQHNNANVMGIGARMHSEADVIRIVSAFLTTPWSGVDRHQRRIEQLAAYEATGSRD